MIKRPSADISGHVRSEQNITYIRQMLGELRAVAEAEKADMLCYLIEMAFMEAGDLLDTGRRFAPASRRRLPGV